MISRPALRQLAHRGVHRRGVQTWTKSSPPRVAVAGVTGAVGQEFLQLLEGRKFPMASLKMLASSRSAGKKFDFGGQTYTVEELTDDSFSDVDIALFSAGGSQSKKFAPVAVKAGALVIDNSSAFRMTDGVPLVVPEVNPEAAMAHKGIIANPNCSTIIMNLAVWPLHKAFGVKRVVCSTYQAASGAGAAAMAELEQQGHDWSAGRPLKQDIFKRQYVWNLFSHNSNIDPSNGYNEEELKMVKETRKIFNDPNICVTATCIRVPVLRAHCESINVSLERPCESDQKARSILESAPGITICDDRANNKHPEPLMASGNDDCFVGRIRQDISQPAGHGLDLFIAGDQIRKGAALNAVQIAELFVK